MRFEEISGSAEPYKPATMSNTINRAAALAAVLGASSLGCASRQSHVENAWNDTSRETCLVLSVGGVKGVAHLGAIEAVKQSGMKVDCVVGTSFGALAGSIYSTAPKANAPERYARFMDDYVAQTKSDKEGGAFLGMLLFGALGATGPAVLAGGLFGGGSVNERDRARFVNVLDRFYGAETIESLPIQFATLYQQRTPTGFRMVSATTGNIANAVGNSAANPLIFQDSDPKKDRELDPGLDRVAAVPVEDACKMFPRARLLAINVTDEPAFYSASMNCPLVEVRVNTPVSGYAALQRGPAFDGLVKAGFDATQKALAKQRHSAEPRQ